MITSSSRMTSQNGGKCVQCGMDFQSNRMDGLCPACLLKQGGGGTDGFSASPFELPNEQDLKGFFPELEKISLIGRGGMGAVYKARQPALDRWVALKILPLGIGGDPAFAERFVREAKALAKLNHPNIVTLYEFGEKEGLYYFLMEYVEGMNLRHLMNSGTLTPKEALAIVPQVCEGLQFAHGLGIVHRDIKPENILLRKDGHIKIADFGLAKIVSQETYSGGGSQVSASSRTKEGGTTEAGAVLGTPNYMAPEQEERPSEVDHRADIYSLGVVLYQMLTGELPQKDLLPPSKRFAVDVRLDEVVLRALEIQPEKRYQQVSELTQAVTEVLQNPGSLNGAPAPKISSKENGQAENQSNPKKKRTWLFATLIFIAGFLLVSVSVALLTSGGYVFFQVKKGLLKNKFVPVTNSQSTLRLVQPQEKMDSPLRLELLTWYMAQDNLPDVCWKPDGTLLTKEEIFRFPRPVVQIIVGEEISPKLCLIFSHPALQLRGGLRITLEDSQNQPIACENFMSGGMERMKGSDLGSTGIAVLKVVSPRDLPKRIKIIAEYGVDLWRNERDIPISDISDVAPASFVDAPDGLIFFDENSGFQSYYYDGSEKRSSTIVSLTYNTVDKRLETTLVAIGKDDREIGPVAVTRSRGSVLPVTTYAFPISKDKIKSFRLKTRLLQKTVFDSVVILPPEEVKHE